MADNYGQFAVNLRQKKQHPNKYKTHSEKLRAEEVDACARTDNLETDFHFITELRMLKFVPNLDQVLLNPRLYNNNANLLSYFWQTSRSTVLIV